MLGLSLYENIIMGLFIEQMYLPMARSSDSSIAFFVFWLAVLLTGFVLFNIFLAIIVDTFVEEKRRVSAAKTVPEELSDILRSAAFDTFRRFGSGKGLFLGYISDAELRDTLKVPPPPSAR